jgi:deoxyadenosine/deoxycytidine kinase
MVIIWLNGGFAAGKTTLAQELHRRLPAALVYDPEDVGLMLWKWVQPNDDFQDLPSWRELVVATALSLRIFLEADPDVLRKRLSTRTPAPDNPESAQEWALSRMDPTASTRQPNGTVVLRSDQLTPTELADEVLAALHQRFDSAR